MEARKTQGNGEMPFPRKKNQGGSRTPSPAGNGEAEEAEDPIAQRIVQELEAARKRLLDTGTRNRLIHVNRQNQRANCLNISDERSDAVFEILRTDGKKMRFKAMGQDSDEADETLFQDESSDPERHTDRYLETRLGPDGLQKRLLGLARDAKTLEEEQGINVLYLALGFLSWFEDKSSAIQREAPLILLPVELVRDRSTYQLRCREDDITANLPLQERLKQDFGITLPEIDEEDNWWPSGYFSQVRRSIGDQEQWQIDEDGMQLGFFSFAKLLMHHDLDPSNWSSSPGSLLGRLLGKGFSPEPETFGLEDRLDEKLDPADIIQVVDADASQTKVIEEVRRGSNLVVQGPPGTGKSQTITNIIAAAVHDGKSVLFMAEKMAALTVVHDRLKRTGLRDMCIELHSRAANKKAMAQELGRTLSAGSRAPVTPTDPKQLRFTRDRLNDICEKLHGELEGVDYSPFEAIAQIVRHIGKGTPPSRLPQEGLERLTKQDRQRIGAVVSNYVKALEAADYKREHPFMGVRNLDLQPPDLQRLASELDLAVSKLDDLASLISPLSSIGLGVPNTLKEALAIDLETISRPPEGVRDWDGVLFQKAGETRLHEALEAGAHWKMARDELEPVFADTAWETSVASLREAVRRGQSSFFARYLGSAYRRAGHQLRGILRGDLPKTPSERLVLLEKLADLQRKHALLRQDESWLQEVFGRHWRGERTDYVQAKDAAAWFYAVQRGGGTTQECLAGIFEELPQIKTLAGEMLRVTKGAEQAVLPPLTRLSYDLEGLELGEGPDTVPIAVLRQRLALMRDQLSRYAEWVQLGRCIQALLDEGLGELVEAVSQGELEAGAAEDEFAYACAETAWNYARSKQPGLDELFNTNRHELVDEFQQCERDRFVAVSSLILSRHFDQLPQGVEGEMRIIRDEIARKRGHKPIRQVMLGAGSMVQRIKPVFLMSPISIAQFLPPKAVEVDLLVIDEASQVRPEDALGAIARAGQLVVVGDQKQLPPTSFFERLTNVDEDNDEGDAPQGARGTEMESILTLCEARGLRQRMLEWHYRSRDPSLIQVSNVEFYDHNLILPPSPLELDKDYGLKFRRVDGVYSSRGRGSGRAATNKIEAQAVVDAMAEHARKWPKLSLGVVAFSKAQTDMMTEVLEWARRQDPTLDAFLREGKTEDVFVKNIENVQGDERDVIFISVGYGPPEPGGRLRSMTFGPVNNDGGERRLNVLFTRARVRCEVFASFGPGDMDLSRTTRLGPRVLKRFLEFAKSGRIDQPLPTGHGPENLFEEDVVEVIRGLGYPVDPQVGSAGFRIDLGVRSPQRPGEYTLAVECDGAIYHSALWARERDRQRQDILEGLGWRFHRIWSTDWFFRREPEIERLREALEAAEVAARRDGVSVRGANETETDPPAPQNGNSGNYTPPAPDPIERPIPTAPAYQKAELTVFSPVEPHEFPVSRLSDLAVQVVQVEGPIHLQEVARRISSAFRKERTGQGIENAVRNALNLAKKRGQIQAEEDFWYTEDQSVDPPVRDRSNESGSIKKPAALPPMEIRAAGKLAEKENGRMEPQDKVRAVARLLGFQRIGPDLQAAIANALE